MKYTIKFMVMIIVIIVTSISTVNSATTKFNYQGKVIFNGIPADGDFFVKFGLYDAITNGTLQISVSQNYTIVNGLLNTELNFGDLPFDGQNLWLQITITDPGSMNIIDLEPRIPINTSPYAIQADFVAANSINSVSIENNSITENDIAIGVIPWNKNSNDISYTNGNVGIGTSTPTGLMHLQGDSTKELQLFGGSSSPVIHFRRIINSADWVLKQDPTGGKFHIQSELVAGNEVLTVDNTGKVGIGTVSPTGVLDVRDSVGDTLLNVFSSGAITRKVVTRSLTLGYPSFQSGDSTLNYKEVFNVGTVDGFQNNPQSLQISYISPLVLPPGAKIISISVLAFDDDPAAEITTSIYQSPFSTSGSDNLIVQAGTGAVPGAVIVTDDTINHSVIAEHSYYILVRIPPQAIVSTDLLFSAVRIRYEIGVL